MRGARAKERGGQVDVEHRLPLGKRQIDRRFARHAPGVVDEHVDAAKRSATRANASFTAASLVTSTGKAVVRLHVEDRDARSRALEHPSGCRPDAFRAACDDGGFSVEAQHIHIAPGVNYTKSS